MPPHGSSGVSNDAGSGPILPLFDNQQDVRSGRSKVDDEDDEGDDELLMRRILDTSDESSGSDGRRRRSSSSSTSHYYNGTQNENGTTNVANAINICTDYGYHGHGVVSDTVDFGTYPGCNNASSSTTASAGAAAATATSDENHHHNNNNSHNNNFIDNRNLTYVPIRLVCGVTAYCSPQTLAACPMILRSLQVDVTHALKVLPRCVHSLVKRTNLWINASYEYGDKRDPYILHHSTTHHSETWLVEVANDIPQKARSIEVYNCFEYERMRLHWNGSGLLLHELCHLIHQHCLEGGLENKTVANLFQLADESGRYECVLRRDWAGRTKRKMISSLPRHVDKMTTALELALEVEVQEEVEPADYDLAYAMVDKKEFFAEMSVAFLSNAYHALDKGDCHRMEECCPPLVEPTVLERVTSPDSPYLDNDDENAPDGESADSCWMGFFQACQRLAEKGDAGRRGLLLLPPVPSQQQQRQHNDDNDRRCGRRRSQRSLMIDLPLQQAALQQFCANVKHCNKFYPFTRGQLQHHDPELYLGMQAVWREISMWDDPVGDTVKCAAK